MWETWVWSLGQEDPLEKEMATHSSILAWRIPWTEEPVGLQPTGSQRVRYNWATSLRGSRIASCWALPWETDSVGLGSVRLIICIIRSSRGVWCCSPPDHTLRTTDLYQNSGSPDERACDRPCADILLLYLSHVSFITGCDRIAVPFHGWGKWNHGLGNEDIQLVRGKAGIWIPLSLTHKSSLGRILYFYFLSVMQGISSDAFQGEGKLHISRSVQVEVEVAQTLVFLSGSLSLSLVHKN